MKHVLTVDLGTTSAKVMLITAAGKVLVAKQAFYPTQFPKAGWSEQDPELILKSVNELVLQCAMGRNDLIATVSFSSAMHSLMCVDERGVALTPLIIWSDMRSAAIAGKLRSDPSSAELYRASGTPIHPMSPLCKMLWLKESMPDVFRNSSRFISIKEYVIWHWSQRWAVDFSVASATGMFDVHQLTWSAKALATIGISAERLSETISPYTRLSITPSACKDLGLREGTTITPGASDGCLANLGSDATGAGDLSITIGTSGAVRMVSDRTATDPLRRVFNYRMDENKFVTGGATNNGTIVIDWFTKNFLHAKECRLDEFVSRALPVDAGSGGLVFLPFVFGERAPYHNPDFRGVFFGLAQHHTIEHMMRSLLEGICYEIRSLVDAVEQSVRPATTIWASGGFVRSEGWVQMLANVLGREIRLRDVNDASSLGAARMGFHSLSQPYDFKTSAAERLFVPDVQLTREYTPLFEVFSKLAAKLNDEFSEIAAIQTS